MPKSPPVVDVGAADLGREVPLGFDLGGLLNLSQYLLKHNLVVSPTAPPNPTFGDVWVALTYTPYP